MYRVLKFPCTASTLHYYIDKERGQHGACNNIAFASYLNCVKTNQNVSPIRNFKFFNEAEKLVWRRHSTIYSLVSGRILKTIFKVPPSPDLLAAETGGMLTEYFTSHPLTAYP